MPLKTIFQNSCLLYKHSDNNFIKDTDHLTWKDFIREVQNDSENLSDDTSETKAPVITFREENKPIVLTPITARTENESSLSGFRGDGKLIEWPIG